jgi:hypothetical protein
MILALLVLILRRVEIGTASCGASAVGLYVLICGLRWLVKVIWRSASNAAAIVRQTVASSFWPFLAVALMPVFHAWYLLWCLPLAVLLLPQRRPLYAAIVFSITALFIIPYFETIRVWFPELLRNPLLGHLIGVTVLVVPPIVTLLWPRKSVPAAQAGI